ncbi:MAG: hypothetical protein V1929_05535 [bacterium]
MKSSIVTTLYLGLAVSLVLPSAALSPDECGADYRFAQRYTKAQLISDAKTREAFVKEFLSYEGRFHQDRVGFNEKNGMTYDAQRISRDTGEIVGMMHWSAAYQEEVHLVVLSMAVAGNERAALFVAYDRPAQAREKALGILTKKIATLERFKENYPAFGGFLPWFIHANNGEDIQPAWNYQDRIVSQENGGFVWALVLADYILAREGETELAQRYEKYWRQLARNSVSMFFDPAAGKIRAASRIVEKPDHPIRYEPYVHEETSEEKHSQPSSRHDWLDSPFFDELMTVFMTVFGTWEDSSQPDGIWKNKVVTKATYETREGKRITVRQGEWYSALEVSTLLYLPYTDVPLVKEVFRLGEVARTVHSAENRIPGLFSMVNIPDGLKIEGAEELYAVGIPSLAQKQVVYSHVIAPYASFSVMLMDEPVGLAWLLNSLKGKKVQGPCGMSEGITVDGKNTALFLTWYAKGVVLMALLEPELNQHMQNALRKQKVYEPFLALIAKEYTDAFGSIADLEGRDLPMMAPSVELPEQRDVPDFRPSKGSVALLQGLPFQGGGELAKHFASKADGSLHLEGKTGFIYSWITPVDIAENPFINFQFKTESAGSFGFELKNRYDMPLNRIKEADRYGGRIPVNAENTHEKWITYSIDLRSLLKQADQTAITFVLVDPTMSIDFSAQGTTITAQEPKDSTLLFETKTGFSPPPAPELNP